MLENSEQSESSPLKYLISILGVVLRAQPARVWNNANTRNMVVSVAALCAHEKPWVRTMAPRGVRAGLTDPVTSMENGLHAAASGVGQFVQQQLQTALSAKGDDMTTVRYLCLLEGIMHKMPSALFKQLAETILKSFTIADPMVKCSALQCLYRCLQRQPCDAALCAETNVLLVKALTQLSPPSEDVTVCAYWMQTLAEAHILARIIEGCVQDNEGCANKLLVLLDRSLNVQSTTVWKYVLRSEMRLFEAAGAGIVGDEFTQALKTLTLLRESDNCCCKQELDFTIGCAVRHVGAPAVLSVIPLDIDPNAAILSTEFSRSWLIPVLRVNIHNAPLAFFASNILPIAVKIYRRLGSLDPVPQRLYTTLQMQLWELLPSFCESPSDLDKSFPQLAPVLGAAMNERDDLKLPILSALRRVVKFALQPDAPERIEVVGAYAKNFMPLLFNIYTANTENDADDKGIKMAVLETIRTYAEVAPKELIAQFVEAAMTKTKDASDSPVKQARILDILCALTRTADCATLEKVLAVINPWWFDTTETTGLQKKAFRILEEILSRRGSPELDMFFSSWSTEFENMLSRPVATIQLPARAAFCACVMLTLDSFDELKRLSDFCLRSLDGIVMSLDKANSTHARSNASKCLQRMLARLIELGGENEQHPSAVLSDILSRIYELATPSAGTDNGSVEMDIARSTLVALNIVAQKQLKVLNGGHISRLVAHGCAWIGDGRAPVRILVI
ncbi:NUC173 domain protein, partial [Oesophagostomum dentatum]